MTRARARLSALCCGVLLTASGRAFRHLRRSAGSRQGIVVSPGGAPTPPECEGANLARGRRPSPRPGIAGRRLPELGTCSPVPPPACSTLKKPHECAANSEHVEISKTEVSP